MKRRNSIMFCFAIFLFAAANFVYFGLVAGPSILISSVSNKLDTNGNEGAQSEQVLDRHQLFTEVISQVKGKKPEALFNCADVPGSDCDHRRKLGECFSNGTSLATTLCKDTCGTCSGIAGEMQTVSGFTVKKTTVRTCVDKHQDCEPLLVAGLCSSAPEEMLTLCRASCGFCSEDDVPIAQTAQGRPQEPCFDDVDVCPYLSTSYSCAAHAWMKMACKKSCKLCGGGLKLITQLDTIANEADCVDYHEECAAWARNNMACSYQADFMKVHCPYSCQLCSKTQGYVRTGLDPQGRETVTAFEPFSDIVPGANHCQDNNGNCQSWKERGECMSNAGYMLEQCRKGCGMCGVFWLPNPPQVIRLNNGLPMPMVGFGTAGLGHETRNAVLKAIKAGYRLLDGAQAIEWYREDQTALAVQDAISQGIVSRDQLFITSKLHPRDHGTSKALEKLSGTLKLYGSDYLDLFMLHYPACFPGVCGKDEVVNGTWQDSWRAMEQAYERGTLRALGVSNFDLAEFVALLKMAKIRPQVLQVHLDLVTQQPLLQRVALEAGVQVVSYSSLGTQYNPVPVHNGNTQSQANVVLDQPRVQRLAQEVQCSPSQVVLRWLIQRGVAVIPRSSNEQHMAQNLDLFSFSFTERQMAYLMPLDNTKTFTPA